MIDTLYDLLKVEALEAITQPYSNNEWYTPAKYVDAAREVFGGSIDLDPASCEKANRTVQAKRYYTEKENGLALPWYGTIWLNPPYGKLLRQTGTSAFVSKLIREHEAQQIEQAIVLTLMGMYSRWFFNLMGMYSRWFFNLLQYPVCFLEEKPQFTKPDGSYDNHAFAACCFYLGPNEQKFIDIFSQFGPIDRRVSPPKAHPIAPSLWEVQAP